MLCLEILLRCQTERDGLQDAPIMHLSFKNNNHNLESRNSFIELRRGSDLDIVEYYDLHTTN